MIKIFFSILKSKSTICWQIISICLICFALMPLLSYTVEYLNEHNLFVSNVYLVCSLILPSAYQSTSLIMNIMLDICFVCFFIYPILQFLSFFLIENPSNTILKIGRVEWVKKFCIIVACYCFVIVLFYSLFIICFYYLKYGVWFVDNNVIITIFLKYLISLFSCLIFFIVFLLSRENLYSYALCIGCYICCCLLLNSISIKYANEIVHYRFPELIGIFLVCLIILICFFVKNIIKKYDI